MLLPCVTIGPRNKESAVRRLLLYFVFLSAVASAHSALALGDDWPKPSPQELSMTSEPKAPGASAIYLYREEISDNVNRQYSEYVRIKILTDAGLSFATLEIPSSNFEKLEARTVQPDGTIVPFTGKPFKKLVKKGRGFSTYRSVITLPEVRVGSIVEFRVRVVDPEGGASWVLQGPLFIRKEAFGIYYDPGWSIALTGVVPSGVKPVQGVNVQIGESPPQNRVSYSLVLTDVPAFEEEEAQPPQEWASWHLDLYYPYAKTKEEYWKTADKEWSDAVDKFVKPDSTIRNAAASLVSPGDTDRQKAQKIYNAIMAMDNLSYTHARTAREDKALHLKNLVTLADNWKQKRGGDDYLAFLYISLARAAGLHAYAMRVADRRYHIFTDNLWTMRQLDDVIVVLSLDGKDVYLDPGALYTPFGQLAWFHSPATGIRQTPAGTSVVSTPYSDDAVNRRIRTADLRMAPDGSVTGSVRFEFYGQWATDLKQAAAEVDNPEVEKAFEDHMRDLMPVDAKVTLAKITGLKDLESPVVVTYSVDGPFATRSSKHMVMPAAFFRHFDDNFEPSARTQPVLMHFAYQETDNVNIELPPGVTAEALPKDVSLPLKRYALFLSKNSQTGNLLKFTRTLAVGSIFYTKDEYPELHQFFGSVRAANVEQAVLKVEKQVAATN